MNKSGPLRMIVSKYSPTTSGEFADGGSTIRHINLIQYIPNTATLQVKLHDYTYKNERSKRWTTSEHKEYETNGPKHEHKPKI